MTKTVITLKFTTSADYAMDGYDVSAVSYVVKPIEAKKWIQYIEVYGKASLFHLGTIKIKTYMPLDKKVLSVP